MTDLKLLIPKIAAQMKKDPADSAVMEDMYSACVGLCKQTEMERDCPDYRFAHDWNKALLMDAKQALATASDLTAKGRFYDIYRKSLKYDAVDSFDSFMLYLELDRPADKRFYQPRRRVLKRFVDALQDLEDDKLDELHMSCPPRVGKSSLTMFFILWIMGRDSERSNLYCSYSDIITAAFYGGLLEILGDSTTYLYKDIFPNAPLVNTNSKDEYLDIGRRKRYHSLTARSLYGTLNGACDASGYIIADDLISGIEEALNPDRLKSAWDKVNNNLLTRGKEKTKIIFIGTRWSLADPIGVRRDLLVNDDKFKYLRRLLVDIPALDDNEESNFDYDYGVGFSTEKYQAVRASFERTNDLASWDAQYMQKPIERSGSLFEPDGMRYYNGELPDIVPDMIIAAIDPAYGGGDYVAMPVAFVYGADVYVHDVVYCNEDKKITVPECVEKVILYGITACQIEGTKSTSSYADDVQEELKNRGQRIRLTTKAASTATSKQDRIFMRAPDIRDNFIFRASGCRSKEYQSFMENTFAFKIAGKNKHDDAPDSLAMLSDMIFRQNQKVEVFRRTF